MKFSTRLTNLGIEISGTGDSRQPLKPSDDAYQKNPRRNYVYAHLDSAGKIFYVGKGEGKRAWSTDRHFLWHRYVEKHLNGKYQVRILKDNLSVPEAEEVEAAWVSQCSDDLVNWFNMGREFDYPALNRYHKLRDANRVLIQQAKAIEKRDLAQAVQMYAQAIGAISQYASIRYETGLVGKLLDEEAEERGKSGEIEALNRLTICLVKLDRVSEAAQHVADYFTLYRRDLQLGASQPILRRIEKALARANEKTVSVKAAEQRLAPDRPKTARR